MTRALDCSEAYGLGEDFSLRGVLRFKPSDHDLPFHEMSCGEVQPTEPVQFNVAQGRKEADFVGTTWGTLYIASDAFVNTLRMNAFTGWSIFPVAISPKKGVELGGYAGFAVTGRCGPIDDSLSQQIILEPPVPGGEATAGLRGMCWDPSSWDGSDFFMPAGAAAVCIVPSVRQALLDAGAATGCEFWRMSEITYSVYD